jgi:hypothetical protein
VRRLRYEVAPSERPRGSTGRAGASRAQGQFYSSLTAKLRRLSSWQDLPVPPYCAGNCVSVEEDSAAQKAFADAVIDRLYALSAVRAKAAASKSAGGAGKKPAKKK